MERLHQPQAHRRPRLCAISTCNALVGQGFSCFLDVDALEEISDLLLIVAGCDVLVFVLTDHIFDSTWCLKELGAAVDAGVPVILVTKEGARWPDEHGNMTATFPVITSSRAIEPPSAQKAFSTKAISHSNEYYRSFTQELLKRVSDAVEKNKARPKKLRSRKRRRKLLIALARDEQLEHDSRTEEAPQTPTKRSPPKGKSTAALPACGPQGWCRVVAQAVAVAVVAEAAAVAVAVPMAARWC